jgi:homopolymeric O-antigen transport system permease protein
VTASVGTTRAPLAKSADGRLVTVPSPEREVYIIDASTAGTGLGLAELWGARELLYFLTWRDIRVRYKQTALGASWAILQPLLAMVVFTVFFGKLAKVPSDGLPYPIFSFTALLPWTYFAQSLAQSSNSLVGSSHLLKKIYFPRLAIPVSTILAGLVDFAAAFIVLVVMMVYYRVHVSATLMFLPLFLALATMTALGVGLWLSALNVKYRDVRHIVPFLTQIWLFATPVAYPSSMLHDPWRSLFGLNPMAGVVEGFRWSLLGTPPPSAMIWISVAVSVMMFFTGLKYFRKVERSFADVV